MEYEEPALVEYFDSFITEFPILSYINQDGLEEVTLGDKEGASPSQI